MDFESNEIVINQCPECNQDIDVTSVSPFSKVTCPHCEKAVRVRTTLGQFVIKGPLGEGGMSQVFAADDVTLGREVALKILHQELSRDDKLTEMFEREAQLTASINHPNVVKVYKVGYENGYFYIAMELVDATSVEMIIAEQGALPEEQVLSIAYDVVSGLKAAYQLNLIHRDIKPGNMLVTKDGTAKLVDFGLAVVQGGADENEDIWATPFYVPPEKLVREPDTHLGDIYALGATCYHALAGQPPFLANTSSLEELIAIKAEGVDLMSVAPHATLPTVKLFEQMMAYSASARPSSYDILLQKIQARQKEIGVPLQVAGHSVKSKGKGLFLKAGIGLIAILALVIFFLLSKGGRDPGDINSLLTGTGDRVISAAEREAVGKMLAGRNAMVKGRFNDARKIFGELEGNENFIQPTRGWNTFNQGLVELLIGNEKDARSKFKILTKQTGFEEKEQKPYHDFFDRIGKILASPLPVLRSDLAVDSESFESIGLLAAGLKNWEMGQFEEANRFFKDFLKVNSPDSDRWIGEMKQAVGSYQKDLELFAKLPNPSRRMSKDELSEAKSTLASARDQLKTRGAMGKVIRARIARVDDFLSLPTYTPPVTSGEWTAAEEAEALKFQNLINRMPDYQSTYLFSGALLQLEGTKAQTPKGIALRQDLIDGFKAAEKFIPGLAERLNAGGFNGIIRRKKGIPIEASITSATPEAFFVDLGFGSNEIGIDVFDPVWLIEASEGTLGTPSEANLAALKETFWFANVCGFTSDANRVAAIIINIDQNFKEEGKRFRKITFAQVRSQ